MAKSAVAHPSAIPPEGGAPNPVEPIVPPAFATPRLATPAALRRCDPLDRAPSGYVRHKVGCRNYSPSETLYILAERGTETARIEAFYLETTGLAASLAKLKARAGVKAEEVESPELAITTLAD